MSEKVYVHELEMLKTSDKIVIEIKAESENARRAFLKKFLEDTEDQYFTDPGNPKRVLKKQYIYSCTLKEER